MNARRTATQSDATFPPIGNIDTEHETLTVKIPRLRKVAEMITVRLHFTGDC